MRLAFGSPTELPAAPFVKHRAVRRPLVPTGLLRV